MSQGIVAAGQPVGYYFVRFDQKEGIKCLVVLLANCYVTNI